MVLENAFDRGDEIDADKASVQYTQKAGYASATLADFLTRLDERNDQGTEARHSGSLTGCQREPMARFGNRYFDPPAPWRERRPPTCVPETRC